MDEDPGSNYIDNSVKRLLRANPAAFFELIGFPTAPDRIRFEDLAIQQTEKRGGHLCVMTDENDRPQGIVYIEYQLTPRLAVVKTCMAKLGAYTERFDVPVVLLAVYLSRGDYADFHEE